MRAERVMRSRTLILTARRRQRVQILMPSLCHGLATSHTAASAPLLALPRFAYAR